MARDLTPARGPSAAFLPVCARCGQPVVPDRSSPTGFRHRERRRDRDHTALPALD